MGKVKGYKKLLLVYMAKLEFDPKNSNLAALLTAMGNINK